MVNNPIVADNISDSTITKIESNNLVNPGSPLKRVVAQVSDSALNSNEYLNTASKENNNELAQNSSNFTDLFIREIQGQISAENPNGIGTVDGEPAIILPDSDTLTADFLANAQEKFISELTLPEIKDSDLKIVEDNNQDLLMTYAQNFDKIVKNTRTGFLTAIDGGEFAEEDLDEIISVYKNTIKSFYLLSVPRLLLGLHKTEIAYLSEELELFEKIKNVQQDPMGAIIASQNISLLEKELNEQVNIEYQKFLKLFNSNK